MLTHTLRICGPTCTVGGWAAAGGWGVLFTALWGIIGPSHAAASTAQPPGEVIGLTPSCNSINFSNVDGQEEWQGLHGCKGLEIAEWLRLNAKEPYRYIILDDEEDFLFSQREHLVKVEGRKGLDKADVRVAIQILNTKEISQMKRWFYGALKFIAVYILMVMLFMAYFYWYPEKEMNNMNRRALMYQECLRSHFHWQK